MYHVKHCDVYYDVNEVGERKRKRAKRKRAWLDRQRETQREKERRKCMKKLARFFLRVRCLEMVQFHGGRVPHNKLVASLISPSRITIIATCEFSLFGDFTSGAWVACHVARQVFALSAFFRCAQLKWRNKKIHKRQHAEPEVVNDSTLRIYTHTQWNNPKSKFAYILFVTCTASSFSSSSLLTFRSHVHNQIFRIIHCFCRRSVWHYRVSQSASGGSRLQASGFRSVHAHAIQPFVLV